MQTYINIAQLETNGISINFLNSYLQTLINNLKNKIIDQDELTLTKINLCISDLNSNLNEDGLFTTTGWHIALFSKKKEEIKKLKYERLSYLIEEEKYRQNNEEEAINDYEIPFFLTSFLIELNKYLHTNISDKIKEKLIIKKYLLLSTPELKNIEDYYLNNFTIDNLELPNIPKYYPKTAFNVLLEPVNCSVMSLDYSNEELAKNTFNMANLIINALFIKTFLELSQNTKEKQNIINLIRNSRFYNYPEFYSITINTINDIIFKETPKLER